MSSPKISGKIAYYIKTKVPEVEHHSILRFAIHHILKSPSNLPQFFIMQTAIVFLAVVAAAAAGVVSPVGVAYPTYYTRAPRFDSAVIKSDRLGGNFAYSVAESHAYAAHTPVVQQVTSPVGVSYSAGAPVVTGYSAGPVAYPGYHAAPGAYSGYGYAAPAYNYAGYPYYK